MIESVDLAMVAARRRQSARTGFVHLFHGQESVSDTIPIYENCCFALELLLQKKTETVLEARQLFLRLLAFQTEEGNFPIYLHDFPRSYDPHLPLKIAPLFIRALKDFGGVLGSECREKIEHSLQRMFSWLEQRRQEKSLLPLWEFRFQVCIALFENRRPSMLELDTSRFTALEWWEYWVSLQFIQTPTCDFYHKGLQIGLGLFLAGSFQDKFEPAPELIDWVCAQDMSERLTVDRSLQVQLSALQTVEVLPFNPHIPGYLSSIGEAHALLVPAETEAGPSPKLHFFWRDELLHSACLEANGCSTVSVFDDDSLSMTLALPTPFELSREALFEVSLFVDASPDISVWIEGQKGTCFSLGDAVSVQSSSRKVEVSFELLEGKGDFVGHLVRSNRSNQRGAIGSLQYESFDWKIALRTLRRSERCSIGFHLKLC